MQNHFIIQIIFDTSYFSFLRTVNSLQEGGNLRLRFERFHPSPVFILQNLFSLDLYFYLRISFVSEWLLLSLFYSTILCFLFSGSILHSKWTLLDVFQGSIQRNRIFQEDFSFFKGSRKVLWFLQFALVRKNWSLWATLWKKWQLFLFIIILNFKGN